VEVRGQNKGTNAPASFARAASAQL